MNLRAGTVFKPALVLLALFAWCGVAFGGPVSDPTGDAGEKAADIVSADVVVAERDVRFTVKTVAPYAFSNTQILLDTDLNAATGFSIGDNGFDLLVEGANIYRFDGGDQSQWTWKPAGSAQREVRGEELAVRLPRKLLAGDFDCLVRTLTDQYAQVDAVPDTGAIHVAAPASTADATKTSDAEAAGDADDASRDITAAEVEQKGDKIVVSVEVRKPGDFAQLLVFFDTDRDAGTGYRSQNAEDCGFEYLLSGGRVMRFNGQTQSLWAWEGLDDARVTVDGAKYRAEFDAGLLATGRANVKLMMMSADWQTPIDIAPDDGTYDLKIDTSKVSTDKKTQSMAAPRTNRDAPPRKRFADAQSFYCYYGSGKVAELSHYDIVIAHSPQMQPADIAALKKLGVVVVGYLTVGEDEKLREGNGKGPGGYASWYLDEDGDGNPDQNGIWKSYYASAADPAWRADRVAEATRLTQVEGYDGIFLDTIDTASAFPATLEGMVQLVNELRAALPDAPIVLNQGFPLLARLAPMADGLMIESFTATYDFQKREYVPHTPSSLDWTKGVADRVIAPVLAKNPLKVLVLDYALPHDRERIQMAADRAATFGYLFAAGPITLDSVYENDVKGKPDSKWLEKQATPDSMRYTLDRDANGFPSSTVVIPSGCYGGYGVAPVVDGVEDRASLAWSDAAWASAEDGDDAWLEFRFPHPLSAGRLRIQWAVDSGRLHASTRYIVEVLQDGSWKAVDQVNGNSQAVTEHRLPDAPYEAVRIHQLPGGGSKQRPDLMWVAQVERVVS